jgi:hypothetical protein
VALDLSRDAVSNQQDRRLHPLHRSRSLRETTD